MNILLDVYRIIRLVGKNLSSSIIFYIFDYIQMSYIYDTYTSVWLHLCFTIATFDGLAPRVVSETQGKKVNYHAGTFKVAENILRDLLAT